MTRNEAHDHINGLDGYRNRDLGTIRDWIDKIYDDFDKTMSVEDINKLQTIMEMKQIESVDGLIDYLRFDPPEDEQSEGVYATFKSTERGVAVNCSINASSHEIKTLVTSLVGFLSEKGGTPPQLIMIEILSNIQNK